MNLFSPDRDIRSNKFGDDWSRAVIVKLEHACEAFKEQAKVQIPAPSWGSKRFLSRGQVGKETLGFLEVQVNIFSLSVLI